jgi:hypothetical protein
VHGANRLARRPHAVIVTEVSAGALLENFAGRTVLVARCSAGAQPHHRIQSVTSPRWPSATTDRPLSPAASRNQTVRRSRLVSRHACAGRRPQRPVCQRACRRKTIPRGFRCAFRTQGAFVWHVGRDHVVSDANQVLFVRGGEDLPRLAARARGLRRVDRDPGGQPPGGLLGTSERRLATHPLFVQRRRPADLRLQRVRRTFARAA